LSRTILVLLLVLTIALGAVSQPLVFAADDTNKRKVKTLEEQCAKKKPTGFDGLVCNAVLGLQNQVDSFFDVFVTIDTFNQSMQSLEDKILELLMKLQQNQEEEISRLDSDISKESSDRQAADAAQQGQIDDHQSAIDSFFDVFTELQLTDTNLQSQIDLLENQRCPPGEFVVGIDENGGIICEPIPQMPPPPPPQGLPVITSFTPISGPVGTLVTINGNDLSGVTDVRFNGVSVTGPANVISSNSITAIVPLGAQTGKISVTTSTGTALSATNFKVSPKIDSFTPTSGNAGDAITITGTNFNGATSVKFNTVSATFTITSDTSIGATVPVTATSGPISITTPSGTATSATSFTLKPKITSFTPLSGPVGTLVTINGVNLSSVTEVRFNGIPTTSPPVIVSSSSIRVIVPDGATTGSITASSPAGTSSPSTSVFKVTPKINSFTPTSGTVGELVTIVGTNFNGVTQVKIGTVIAPIVSSTATEIVVTVPATAVTGKISVTTPDGVAVSVANFTVL